MRAATSRRPLVDLARPALQGLLILPGGSQGPPSISTPAAESDGIATRLMLTHGVKANRSIPSSTVIPVLIYPDVREAVAWLEAA